MAVKGAKGSSSPTNSKTKKERRKEKEAEQQRVEAERIAREAREARLRAILAAAFVLFGTVGGVVTAVLAASPNTLYWVAGLYASLAIVALVAYRMRHLARTYAFTSTVALASVAVILAAVGIAGQTEQRSGSRQAACEQLGAVFKAQGTALLSMRERSDVPVFTGAAWERVLRGLDRASDLSSGLGEEFESSVSDLVENWTTLSGNTFPNSSGNTYFSDGLAALTDALEECDRWGVNDEGEPAKAYRAADVCESVRDLMIRVKRGDNPGKLEQELEVGRVMSRGLQGDPPEGSVNQAAAAMAITMLSAYYGGDQETWDSALSQYVALRPRCQEAGVRLPPP